MDLGPFIDRVCADGIAAARTGYARLDQAQELKGCIEGFELCWGIEDGYHLLEALHQSNARALEALADGAGDYRRWSCRFDRIEWVCDVVSAALVAQGLGSLGPLWPTGPAMLEAAGILGVTTGAGVAHPRLAAPPDLPRIEVAPSRAEAVLSERTQSRRLCRPYIDIGQGTRWRDNASRCRFGEAGRT